MDLYDTITLELCLQNLHSPDKSEH